MRRAPLYTSHRRLSAIEIELAHQHDRADASWSRRVQGCSEVPPSAHPFVMPRRPATRRQLAFRVSRPRVLPASHAVSR